MRKGIFGVSEEEANEAKRIINSQKNKLLKKSYI